ncbi:MAG: Abi family protein, partial [Odoribacter sp.]|nr:Abi family protein [Odoribacter sp.]
SALWYVDSDNFTDKDEHREFIARIEEDLNEAREDFILHFRDNYADRFPPVWIALQIVSFGTLIKVFRNFNRHELQFQVAKHFGCDSVNRFISWMNALVYLRNICSHHARLWNRLIKKRPEAYNFGVKAKRWTNSDVSKLYYSVCIIGFLLKNLYPGNSFKKKLANLFDSNAFVNSTKGKYLGFPNNWQAEFVWE